MRLRNAQTEACRLLVQSLAQAGVQHAVISPGSRSTPLVLALLQCSLITPHLVVDERSAGFFALGQAQVSRLPSLLVCTSGSALAHYLPSVVEAKAQRLPLIVLSADRPKELQGNESPQTLDQEHFFGRHVVAHLSLSSTEPETSVLRALRRQVAQAVALSLGPLSGPVHLNVPLRKPLEPRSAENASERELASTVNQLLQQSVPQHVAARQTADASALACIRARAQAALRPALAIGPLPHGPAARDALLALAGSCGWPVYAETTSQCRSSQKDVLQVDALEWVLQSTSESQLPDFVLSFGRPLTSRAWNQYLARAGRHCTQVAVTEDGVWSDPHNSVSVLVEAPVQALAAALVGRLPAAARDWVASVKESNDTTWSIIEEELTTNTDFDEAQAARAVVAQLHSSDALVLGNSLSVRLVDQFARAPQAAPRIVSQRGLNGIDGLNSLAAGVASLHSPGHIFLLLGDISFLHDIGGLAQVASQRALTIVVMNNGGGRIFEQLPLFTSHLNRDTSAEPPEPSSGRDPRDYWTTPHSVDLARAAAVYDIAYDRCEDATQFEGALARRGDGPRIVEAALDETSLTQRMARILSALKKTTNAGN